MNISKRLRTVAAFIPRGSVLADIGTDHAYLPIYALQNGLITRAIGGDVREGPLQMARKHVKHARLEEKISIRLGDGLKVIQPEEQIDCITICGMGGSMIASILEEGRSRLAPVKRLILQPNNGEEIIRRWLMDHDWELCDERIIEEEGHIYEILVAKPGDGHKPYINADKELFFGPFLLREKPPIFQLKWKQEKKALEHVLEQLEKASNSEEIREKKADITRKIGWIEEVLSDGKRS